MKKSSLVNLLLAGALLLALSSGAWAYDFNDTTLAQEWRYSAIYGSGNWTDVIGDASRFDTFGANLTNNGKTFTIYTNWNPGKDVIIPAAKTADLFITDVTAGKLFAIRLETTGQGTVYVSPTYNTSVDEFSSSGYIYGGRYDQGSPKAVPVWVTTASSSFTTSVVWSSTDQNVSNNSVVIDLTGLNLGNDTWSFVWGTGTCSNDAFSGTQPGTGIPSPEPTTMILLGLGLIGLAGSRRFKK